MSFEQRLVYLLIGLGVGFILGYQVRSLRALKSQQDTENKTNEDMTRGMSNDEGAIRVNLLERFALLLVVCMTAYAAISSQLSSNKSDRNTAELQATTKCTVTYQSKLLKAVNARTRYSAVQSDANRELQKSQADFLGKFITPSKPTQADLNNALRKYFGSLTNFVEISSKANESVKNNPYPTVAEFQDCIKKGK